MVFALLFSCDCYLVRIWAYCVNELGFLIVMICMFVICGFALYFYLHCLVFVFTWVCGFMFVVCML